MSNKKLEFAREVDGQLARYQFKEGEDATRTDTMPRFYSATGYGAALPVGWKVRIESKFYRVYASRYSNVSTLYIRRQGFKWIVDIEEKEYEPPSAQVWELWNKPHHSTYGE